MIKDSELMEPIKRALSNSETRASDQAAISRMQAHLEASLGTSFDEEVVRPTGTGAVTPLRRLGWLGGGAIVVGLVLLGVRPAAPELPLSAAMVAPAEEASAPQPLAAAPEWVGHEEHAPAPTALAMSAEEPRATSSQEPPARSRRPARVAARKPQAGNPRHPDKASVSPASAAPSAGLAEELSGLDQIRALITTSPERALAAVAQQQQQFPRGALHPERALLRLDALLRLGRADEAQQLAQQLLATQNNQPYRARIRELLSRAK